MTGKCTIPALILAAIFFLFGGPALADSKSVKLSELDYSDPGRWLMRQDDGNKEIDIFAVYPTVTNSDDPADKPFVRLDSPLMREGALDWLNRVDDLVTAGNVHAPLYRQLNGVMLASLDSQGFEGYTEATPRDDVFAAFDYYLQNVNKGRRPFILFGHSQGGKLVAEIAARLLGDEKYAAHNRNHIATYAIGFSVTRADVERNPALKFASAPDDTGVILSWNTTAPGEIAGRAYKGFGTWKPNALTINPLSWTIRETLAHAADNPGARLITADGSFRTVPGYANALVDNEHGVLVTTTVPESDYESLGFPNIGLFHPYDTLFFHESIKANLRNRIEAFRRK